MSNRQNWYAFGVITILASAMVMSCGGGGGGSAPATSTPVITSFSPASGEAGAMVVIAGTNFDGTQAVSFGGAPPGRIRVNDSDSITALVPEGALTGVLSLTTPHGNAHSPAAFTVLPSLPTITEINPRQGPVLTNVIIKGTHFTEGSTVKFGGLPATATRMSASELQVVVPGGAPVGASAIEVTTPAGPVVSSTAFNVKAAGPTLDLFVDGFYITQSVQNYEGTVPLVANRKGLLRVFVRANEFSAAVPTVHMSLNGGLSRVLLTDPVSSVPTSINEGDLFASWDFEMPAANFTPPSIAVTIDVDFAGVIPEADDFNNSLGHTFSVNTASPFNVTIIPVVQSGRTGVVGDPTGWTGRFQNMYPTSGNIVPVLGTPYTTTANLETGGSPTESSSGWVQLLEELELKRRAEASTRYYYGAVNVAYSGGIAGLGYVGLPTAIGWDKPSGYQDGGNYPEIFAHEVGHNLGRGHAPGNALCSISGTDPLYPFYPPYPNGSIGQWGWDPSAPPGTFLRSPETNEDIMSYCSPLWVSEYTYRGIMTFRAASPLGAVAIPQECLLVSGRIRDGQVSLGASFRVAAIPQLPVPGAYTLQLQDGQGAALQEISFAPVAVADLPDGSEQHFAFTIPLNSGVEPALAGLRVLERGAVRASRVATLRTPGVAAGVAASVRPAVSVRMRPGQAHLSWDPIAYPRVMVRDPRTGEVLSFAEGGSLDLETDAQQLDVTFSDGVRSTRQILAVQ